MCDGSSAAARSRFTMQVGRPDASGNVERGSGY